MKKKLTRSLFLILAYLAVFFTVGFSISAQSTGTKSPKAKVEADRWVEIDLYWFERDDIQGTAERFWKRCAPLFAGAEGWRGVIINVGWTVDYVMDWRGDLAQQIPFPIGIKQEPWFAVGGQLTGDTAERLRQWKERFAKPVDTLKRNYGAWTYADLEKLVTALHQVAEQKYGLAGMRVGALVLGWPKIYAGKSAWAEKHPDAYLNGNFDPGCFLGADATAYGAFPKGIPAGTPVYEFFGKQWGSLSKALGLDVIVLRDSILLPVSYARGGPFGKIASSPVKATDWNKAAAALVRVTKKSNPKALVIGYSNGSSAVSDWRANCVDLESIARDGFLDAWIDQTWAGSWNEVGVRANGFWNVPTLGWTYQLAYMLLHGAILADTDVRHYHLAETFDAWESWDVIHTAPERLKWGIWAYSHAAVKTPEGLKLPSGTYISWANQGKRLLSEQDVNLLAETLDAAYRDSAQVKEVYGPTLVYCREAMAWQMAHAAPDREIKEWLDEQFGTVMKWPVPVMSATRLEWLPKVKSDLFFVQTPIHLTRESRDILVSLVNSGQPLIAAGSPVDGVDPELSKLIGFQTLATNKTAYKTNATLAPRTDGITDGLPTSFSTFQWWNENQVTGDGQAVYSVNDSPALVVDTAKGRRVAFWDPPEFVRPLGRSSLRQHLGGSVIPYVLVAREANSFLAEVKALHASAIAPDQAVAVESWGLRNGEVQILAGNLEEGLREDADFSRRATLVLPWKNYTLSATSVSKNDVGTGHAILEGENLTINFKQAEAGLFTLKPAQ